MSYNEMARRFLELDTMEKTIKKERDTLKKLLLEFAGESPLAETEDFSIVITEKKSNTLDTKTLYKDFPDIKTVYGKETVSKSVAVIEKALAKKAVKIPA